MIENLRRLPTPAAASVSRNWATDPARDIAETRLLTARAAELGRDDAMTLASTGFTIANILNDLDATARQNPP
jgi:hypothetical protein